ncbi:MAG: hypothetical protein ACK55I_12230, partial [bacterium]
HVKVLFPSAQILFEPVGRTSFLELIIEHLESAQKHFADLKVLRNLKLYTSMSDFAPKTPKSLDPGEPLEPSQSR